MTQPHTLLVSEGAVHLQECGLYKRHFCAIVHVHHVCPKSWFEAAERAVATPKVTLCPSCHANVHAAMDSLLAGRDVRAIPHRCLTLARRGIALGVHYGLTPAPTL